MRRGRARLAGRAATGLAVAALLGAALTACGAGPRERVLTFSGSALGQEGAVVRRQLARFAALHPGVRVELRPTPDAADQRHQLYVQWLNAHVSEPDVLQLDVIWTPEFAAAGWILPLDRFRPPVDSFFPATIAANRWGGRLYALPWFVDVGMLYWRRDLLPGPPSSLETLPADVGAAQRRAGLPYGFVWQGARYEGLVTVFSEVLGGFGGRILDDSGDVVVDAPAAVRALTYLRDLILRDGVSPAAVLTWQEEQSRFAFQNGQAVLLRNWPYAYAAMSDPAESRVAGRFAVAPMPAAPGGAPTAALGGSQLAVNAYSDQPEDAYALIRFLLAPAQMLERARAVGQFPTRPALYDTPELAAALAVPPAEARRVIERAVPRPVTPVYTQLSEILQIELHRALTRQAEPAAALHEAARRMRRLLERTGLAPGARRAAR
ncbi:MAG: ABC transporter substrate-binding protein [Gemmatimonadetes bacterium]|nr:ABC transporter substrate-binding protein [Gemmatimonadota bacterium]